MFGDWHRSAAHPTISARYRPVRAIATDSRSYLMRQGRKTRFRIFTRQTKTSLTPRCFSPTMTIMISAGIDIGSINTKIVFYDWEKRAILHNCVEPTGFKPKLAGETVFRHCLKATALTEKEVGPVVATGYGRHTVRFARDSITEITALARGLHHLSPDVRTIFDIGGQDSKVVTLDETGRVRNFAMNDRCAAGTGHFLQTMANALKVKIEDFGRVALESSNPVLLSSLCVVMAESEVLSLVAEDRPVADIIAGIHYALARRVVNLAAGTGIVEPLAFCGGVACNQGMRLALEDTLGRSVLVPADPITVSALGAALTAQA
jgi:predicted CoA-substrate-specific enzyme activase